MQNTQIFSLENFHLVNLVRMLQLNNDLLELKNNPRYVNYVMHMAQNRPATSNEPPVRSYEKATIADKNKTSLSDSLG